LLRKIAFKFGAGTARLKCRPGVVTIFVGPNNSGKSLALAEMYQLITQDRASTRRRIIQKITVALPKERALRARFLEAVAKDLSQIAAVAPKGDASSATKDIGQFLGVIFSTLGVADLVSKKKFDPKKLFPAQVKGGTNSPTNEDLLKALMDFSERAQRGELEAVAHEWIKKGAIRLSCYLDVLKPQTISLGGTARLALVKPTSTPRWREKDDNLLVNLLKHPSRLEVLRDIVHSEFQLYPVIDTTDDRKTWLKLARKHPGQHERSTTPGALKYFDKARSVEEFSDGVRAFIGLLAAVLSQDYKFMIIDEPEAFLHPPLARRLGAELCKLARKHRAQVLTATHSSDFLMGCVQAGHEVSIVRLTYKNRKPTARRLSPDALRDMMRNPLLRSTGVLGALFHEGAVVCESDSDRAFYQEINERLVMVKKGHRGCAFLNAQNKQTINRIIAPLRAMGIPAAAIVDLDVLSKGDELSRLLDAAHVGEHFKQTLRAAKERFFNCFLSKTADEEEARKRMKQQGLAMISPSEQRELKMALLEPLAQHGIFVVPTGELESWLPQLGISRSDKARWLTRVFERMGDDPEDAAYVRPQQGDVWGFMEGVVSWIANPESGMPSQDE
jgi:hypothetical protein